VTGSLADLVLAAAVFVASHLALPVPGVRARLVERLGEWGYLGFYSALSIVLLLWMVAAFVAAPAVQLWQPPTGLRHLALTLVFLGVMLAVVGYTQRNPTAVVLDRFAAGGPTGVTRVTRHPVMWGVGLWAVAHLLANGDARASILFGGFAVLAFAGTVLIDRRRRLMGGEAWKALEAQTSNIPFIAMIGGRAGAGLGWTIAEIGMWRIGLGCAVYALLFMAHPWIAGLPAIRL